MLFIIDCRIDRTIVHRINYNQGEYMPPKILRGHLANQVDELFGLMKEYICNKIVFDKTGVGLGFYKWFFELINRSGIKVDNEGNVSWDDVSNDNLQTCGDLFSENLLAWNNLDNGNIVTLYKNIFEYKISLTVGRECLTSGLSLNDLRVLSKSLKNAVEKEDNNG